MMKKWMTLLFVLMLIPVLTVPASASGSILVRTDASTVCLYSVGTVEGRGYRLDDLYGGGYLTYDDTLSADLAMWLCTRAAGQKSMEAVPETPQFWNLEEGLYLVCADGAFPPFLVTIPWDGYHWQVEVDPLAEPIPRTGDPVGVRLLALAASGAGILVLGRRRKMC